MVGFSVSYENDYVNLLQMLDLARIPLLAAERDERHPLIHGRGSGNLYQSRAPSGFCRLDDHWRW